MGRTYNHVRNTISIHIARGRHRPAVLAAELLVLDLLKFRVVELSYYPQGGPAEHENLAHILGLPEAGVCIIEITILKWRSHRQIRHSVRIDITDLRDGAPKLGSGIFRVRVEHCCRPRCRDKKRGTDQS